MEANTDTRMAERRKHPRCTLFRAISLLQGNQELVHGRTVNISKRGAYFITTSAASELEVGRRLHMEIGIPRLTNGSIDLVPIGARATICRLERFNGEWGVAVYFDRDMDVGF